MSTFEGEEKEVLLKQSQIFSFISFFPRKLLSVKIHDKTLKQLNDTHRESSLTILTGKDWCFTQFSTGMAGWLLLIFLICLHNQLSSIHSIISTDV